MAEKMGDWGKRTDFERGHVTQTNDNARDGSGVHVTTQIERTSVRDYFDKNGNYERSTWGENK
jgi:hypothetical protein